MAKQGRANVLNFILIEFILNSLSEIKITK